MRWTNFSGENESCKCLPLIFYFMPLGNCLGLYWILFVAQINLKGWIVVVNGKQ